MFRPLKGHHQAFCLKQYFKDLFQTEGLMMTL